MVTSKTVFYVFKIMTQFYSTVAAQALHHPSSVSYFLASVLCILLRFYFQERKRKKLWKPSIPEILLSSKQFKRKIPTVTYWFPFSIPLIDGIITLLRLRRNGVAFFEDCQNKFGKVYWLPFGIKRFFMMNDVDMVQKVLSSKDPKLLNKPTIYDKVFIVWLRRGLTNAKFPVWANQRKVLNRCFTYNSLQNYLQIINKHGRDLVNCLGRYTKGSNGNIEDANIINQIVHYQVTKIISDILMGTSSLSDDTAVEFDKHFRVLMKSVSDAIINPFIKLSHFWYFNSKAKEQNDAIHFMTTLMKKNINKNRIQFEQEMSSQQNDQCTTTDELGIKKFRCLIQEMLYIGATNQEITNQVANFMAAGHESTHITLQLLMLHMAFNPIHQSRCRDEVDKLINQKICNNEFDALDDKNHLNFEMGDLANLKCLERCIMESARITPAFPIIMRVLNAPLKISDDLELPSGTEIVIPIWMIQRDPDNFPSPATFDPDRFLTENARKMNPYSYIPFSLGPRNCIGSKLALMEIKVLMAMILRHFEIVSNDTLENIKLFFAVSLKPEQNYSLILKQRKL